MNTPGSILFHFAFVSTAHGAGKLLLIGQGLPAPDLSFQKKTGN
jgi:hypothetical protein